MFVLGKWGYRDVIKYCSVLGWCVMIFLLYWKGVCVFSLWMNVELEVCWGGVGLVG